MNRIQEQVLNASARSKDKKASALIRKAIVPHICSRATWYKYLDNERQPSLSTASEILQVLKIWLPELTLDDLVEVDPQLQLRSKIKLVK